MSLRVIFSLILAVSCAITLHTSINSKLYCCELRSCEVYVFEIPQFQLCLISCLSLFLHFKRWEAMLHSLLQTQRLHCVCQVGVQRH